MQHSEADLGCVFYVRGYFESDLLVQYKVQKMRCHLRSPFTQRSRNKFLHWRQQKPETLPISSEKSNAPRTDCKGIF